jgi:hypothetical protein
VAAEAKLVDVAWEKTCVEEKVECAPGYGAPSPASTLKVLLTLSYTRKKVFSLKHVLLQTAFALFLIMYILAYAIQS